MEAEIVKPWVEQGILGGGWLLALWLLFSRDRLLERVLTALNDQSRAYERLADLLGREGR